MIASAVRCLVMLVLLTGVIDASEPTAIPQTFSVRIGGMLGSTFRVELSGKTLDYSVTRRRETSAPVKVTPTTEQWREFRKALDEANVWRWKSDYLNRRVMDGTQWSLDITYADRSIKAAGSNSYPDDKGKANGQPQFTPAFARYLAAVEKLLGGKPFK